MLDKRGKKIIKLVLFLFVIIFVIDLYQLKIAEQPFLSPAEQQVIFPENCSDNSIKQTWDSVFKESSDSINIIILENNTINNYCAEYFAYKAQGTKAFTLIGNSYIYLTPVTNSSGVYYRQTNQTSLEAVYANTTFAEQEILSNFSAFAQEPVLDKEDIVFFLLTNASYRKTNLTEETRNTEFESVFYITAGENWIEQASTIPGKTLKFFSSYNTTIKNGSKTIGNNQGLEINYTLDIFEYFAEEEIISFASCIQNWTAYNTTCNSNEEYIVYYTDTNNCNNATGQLSNQTIGCDYDSNNLIGDIDDFDETNTELNIYIGNILPNSTSKFNTTKTVEFKEANNNTTRIKFSYSFSSPLNIKDIEIKMQPSSSSFGYLIVNGIDATKTIYVDKKSSSSSKICLKNSDVSSIGELTYNCSASSEHIINCPGNYSSYWCNISGSKFIVSGLTHSAVKEYIDNSSCTPNWNCTSWTNCTNNLQNRTCTDLNSCGTTQSKPSVTQACNIEIPCRQSWNCTEWQPEKCPANGTQTRTCTDLNSCTSQKTKEESQNCEFKSSKILIIAIIISLVLLSILVIVFLVYTWIKNKKPKIINPPISNVNWGQNN